MDVLLKFTFRDTQPWSFDQHILQRVFYNIIKPRGDFHGNSFGLFCFSNIFPFEKWEDYKPWVDYNLTFSSIDENIVNSVYEKLLMQKEFDFWKDNKITVKKVSKQNSDKIFSWKVLKAVTPIVLSLDKELIKRYWIESKRIERNKPLYWNKDMGFDIFINQLNKNILRKYLYLIKNGYIPKLNDFDQKLLELDNDIEKFNDFAESQNFFKWYKFKRWALLDFKKSQIAGSLWDFKVWDDKNLNKVLYYINQIWFGERNTAWFGFIK